MNKFIKINLFSCVTVLVLANCSGEEKLATSSESPTPLVDGVPADSPLFMRLNLRWEASSESSPYEYFQACYLNQGVPMGTCTIKVPEARLFYSDVEFSVGTTDAVGCPIVHFQPYYYRRSNTTGYYAPGVDKDTDCSKSRSEISKDCYGGAAPQIVSDFPKNTSLYFLSMLNTTASFKISSSNKIRSYSGRSNMMLTNDLPYGADADAVTSTPATGRYLNVASGNAARLGGDPDSYFTDYYISCENLWGETTREIKIMIEDENVENGINIDDYPDWDTY